MNKYLMCCVIAVMAMMGITACSSDDEGSSGRANVVVFNGESKPIVEVLYGKVGYVYHESVRPADDDYPFSFSLYLDHEDYVKNRMDVDVTNNLLGKRRELGDNKANKDDHFSISYFDKNDGTDLHWRSGKTNSILDGSYLMVGKASDTDVEIEFDINYKVGRNTYNIKGYYKGPFS